MSQRNVQEKETPRGRVELLTYVTARELDGLDLDEGIGVFPRYRSILTSKQSLAALAANQETNLCLAVQEKSRIIGYCVRRPPPAGERWSLMQPPVLYELFGENARGWRDLGLMKPMLAMVVNEMENEERILYIVGYSWSWDLDGSPKGLQQYRQTIIHLLTPFGLKQYPTNEPNVSLRPENLFMARIGDKVDQKARRRFTNLLFGLTED